MSLRAEPEAVTGPKWASARRLAPAAFAVQSLVSLLLWLLVNDKSREGAWANDDFGQWLALSLLCTVLAGVASRLTVRRPAAALAVTTGCALAVVCGCALFAGYAVLNSA